MDDIISGLVPIVFFGCVVLVVIVPITIKAVLKNRERERLHETLRMMVEKGQPVSADLLDTLNSGPPSRKPPNDMRRGVILAAIALALAGMGLALGLTGHSNSVGPLVGVAAFPGFLGLGFIVLALVQREKPRL